MDQKDEVFLTELQNDFNHGQAFDLTVYADKLSFLCSMGFDRTSSVEALVVLNDPDPEVALQFLLLDAAGKQAQREQARQERGSSLLSFDEGMELARQIQGLRAKARKAWLARMVLEKAADSTSTKLEDFSNFLKGLCCKGSISEKDWKAIEDQKQERQVSEDEFVQIVKSNGLSIEIVEKFRTRGKDGEGTVARDCVTCWDDKKDHISLSCMHLTLCPTCAEAENKKVAKKCPMCNIRVEEYVRIYM